MNETPMKHLDLTLKVECTPGTDIREACTDLCELADRVGVLVEAKFNGVHVWARKGDNPLRLVDAYHQAVGSPCTFKVAQCR